MNTQESYDRLAKGYVSHVYDELRHKAFDRKMLDLLVEKVNNPDALICDMGCGPGQVARYLHEHGAKTCGIDLSPGMIEQARALNPGIPFETGNMLDLVGVADQTYGGIAAFYSIVHFTQEQLAQAVKEMWRVLQSGGVPLIAFHIGSEVRHFDELWGESCGKKYASLDGISIRRSD
jgi:ubiquinone/menaquinone biosynthesis C-methylase UbiE